MSTAVDDDDVLEPDDDTMHRFLIWWFGKCNRGYIEIGWIDTSTDKLTLFKRFGLHEVSQAVHHAATVNAIMGANVYYRTATVDPSTQFTKDCDVVQIPGCWVDCDAAGSVARVLGGDGPAPSAQVITGQIPDIRAQFLYKSSEPILVGDRVRILNRRAAAAFDSDTMVVNPSTLLRLPGSIAWPKKPGRVAELTEWVTPDRHQDSWTLDALKAGFPPVADEEAATAGPRARADRVDDTTELLNPIKALIDQVRSGALWHEPVLRLVAMLVNRGRQDCEILAMAEHLTWPDHTVSQTRDELIKMLAGARAKGFAPDGPNGPDGPDADDQQDDGAAPDVEDVMDVPPKAGAKPFQLLTDTDIEEMPDPVWLIDKILVQNSLAALYGPWGSFKSFIALDWALSLATGTDWHGRKVQRVDVLYICAEGVGGLKNRIAAWKQHHGITRSIAGFRVIPMAVNLMDLAEAKRLILHAQAEQVASGFTPAVIICDTLARSMVGGDENSVRDTGLAVNNTDLIRRELGGITFLPVHHAGKDADRGMRGSTGLPGAMDTVFRVTRNGMAVELTCEKQKDGEDSWSLHLAAEKVILPLRPGTLKPRDSLVLVPGEASASTAGKPGRPKGDAGLGLAVLFDTVVAEGFQLPIGNGFPSTPMRGTTEMAWRREFYRRLSERSADAKKHAFSRMLKELRDAGLVGLCDTKVWSVKQDDPARPGHAE